MGTNKYYVIKQVGTYWSHDSLSLYKIWTCLVELFLSYSRNNPTSTNIWKVLSLTVVSKTRVLGIKSVRALPNVSKVNSEAGSWIANFEQFPPGLLMLSSRSDLIAIQWLSDFPLPVKGFGGQAFINHDLLPCIHVSSNPPKKGNSSFINVVSMRVDLDKTIQFHNLMTKLRWVKVAYLILWENILSRHVQ